MESRDPERAARQAAAMHHFLKNLEAEDGEMAARTAPPMSKVPPGWYAHPSMARTQRYWDGERWTDDIAPMPASAPRPTKQQSQLVSAVLIAGSAAGLIMSLQSASLLTGTGTIWTGVAIAIGAAIVTWMVNGIPTWVSAVCVIAALIATTNAVSVDNQLDRQRHKIDRMLN